MPRHAVSLVQLSTYPPTQCGLATFAAALHRALEPWARSSVVQVASGADRAVAPEVVGHLVNGSTAGATAARSLLDAHDVVVVQHEYGIFGGPDGSDVVDLVRSLTTPVVVVLHTVLERPTARQRFVLLELMASAALLVTMTSTARERLLRLYGADPLRVVVVPHGAVDHRAVLPVRRTDPRPLVLTWGLLGPGKGIEHAVDAMAGLRDLDPRYLVVGRTHPKVLQREGPAYVDGLRARVAHHGLGDVVELDDSYLGVGELAALVASADLVLLPYDSRDQVTSGVLTEAVAAGRPVVSTSFPHAVELLTDGPGLLVPQGDPGALAAAVRRVLTEPLLAADLARRARAVAPTLVWDAVGRRYAELAAGLVGGAHAGPVLSSTG